MELAPNVTARIATIHSDEVHGASWLSRQALGAVAICAADVRKHRMQASASSAVSKPRRPLGPR